MKIFIFTFSSKKLQNRSEKFFNKTERKKNPRRIVTDSTTPYTTLTMSQIDDSIPQQDQPDSSSEIPMFTLIPPDAQQQSTSAGLLKNDSNNNNNNDRNNNTGKTLKCKIEDSEKKSIQRYAIESESHHAAVHHPHPLLLLQQQQQQMNQQMSMDGKNLIQAPENSPSLIVLQPSAQSAAGYSSFFNHYATGK